MKNCVCVYVLRNDGYLNKHGLVVIHSHPSVYGIYKELCAHIGVEGLTYVSSVENTGIHRRSNRKIHSNLIRRTLIHQTGTHYQNLDGVRLRNINYAKTSLINLQVRVINQRLKHFASFLNFFKLLCFITETLTYVSRHCKLNVISVNRLHFVSTQTRWDFKSQILFSINLYLILPHMYIFVSKKQSPFTNA